MITNLDAALNRVAERLDLKIGVVVRKVTLDLFTKITERTPVDTGRARASWQIGIGSPRVEVPGPGEYAGPTVPQVKDIDGKEPVFITSALVYIEPLEKGHSAQAPAGMVEISLIEVEEELRATQGSA